MIDTARDALWRMFVRDGSITPEAVVAEARDETSPEYSNLHKYFTWDVQQAAEERWREQAKGLIRRYWVTVEIKPESFVRLRAFSSIPTEDGPAYVSTESAMRSPETRDLIMQQAKRDVESLRLKYKALIDFDAVLREVLEEQERKVAS